MIISASYKTDIPAFYGDWFVNRLNAGYCLMRNPMNRKIIRVPMIPHEIDGIVFWTKNFRPFFRYLPEVKSREIPFSVQYTINGYPKSLEHNVVDWKKSVEAAHSLAHTVSRRCVVWRYDTIILTSETPVSFHLENFSRLATALEGATDEVVISFLQLYKKTERNLSKMASETHNDWWEPSEAEKRGLAAELFSIANRHGIELTICSQPELLTVQTASRCIDSKRLADVGGRPISSKTVGNRPGCECAASRDIGDYDTCPHGCVYCYAVRSNDLAIRRFQQHDPKSEFLFTDSTDEVREATPFVSQLRLFD